MSDFWDLTAGMRAHMILESEFSLLLLDKIDFIKSKYFCKRKEILKNICFSGENTSSSKLFLALLESLFVSCFCSSTNFVLS